MTRHLKPEYQQLADDFELVDTVYGGCCCHINPPCSWCTHEGNPLNLEEDDEAWEDDD